MGGIAGTAGEGVSEPLLLVGGDATLVVGEDRPIVWLVSLDDPVVHARAERAPLGAADYAAMAPFHDGGERLVRRRLAKLVLTAAADTAPCDIAIERGRDGGTRVLVPRGWHLGVAARWPDCVIAVASEPIGVDLERVTTEPVPLDLLTVGERRRLASLSPDRHAAAFADYWAAKEAHAKWTGAPRSLDPAAIEAADPNRVSSALGTTRCWRWQRDDLAIALCIT